MLKRSKMIFQNCKTKAYKTVCENFNVWKAIIKQNQIIKE